MSFPPGVPLQIPRSVYTTSTVPSGAMMVQMAPVPVSQVMVRPVMQPIITAQPMMVARPTQLVQTNQQIWIKSPTIQAPPVLQTPVDSSLNEDKSADATSAENGSDTDPSITVFVGNISDRASDALIRQILMKCGSVYTWKRVQGASGKLQAFGFCEYRDPESALRAICILHDFQLGDKKLLVKVDAKTQELIDEWKKLKGIEDKNEDGSLVEPTGVADARSAIEVLLIEYAGELNTAKPDLVLDKPEALQQHKREYPTVRESQNVEENLKELELEEEQKNFISKEIRSFRETQKIQEERHQKDRVHKDKDSDKRHKDRDHDREPRDRHRERSQRNESPSRRQIHRTRSRSPRRREISRQSSPPRRRRTRSPIPRRSPPRRTPRKSRSPPPRRRSPGSPITRRRVDENDEDSEVHEQRRLERKIREKEAAYQARLNAFEGRERRRNRDLEKRDEKEIQQRKELIREAKRLREFLADYDDDRSDSKYYMGSALTKRQREYEREQDADERDRKKEQDEIDALRKRLIEEHHPDPDTAIAKVIKETENIWEPLLQPDTPPSKSFEEIPVDNVQSSSASSSDDEDSNSNESDKSDSDSSDSESEQKPKKKGKEAAPEKRMIASMNEVKTEAVSQPTLIPIAKSPIFAEAKESSDPAQKMEFSSVPSPAAAPLSMPQVTINPAPKVDESARKLSPNPQILTTATNKRKKLTVSDVFNQDEEEDELPRKRKLVPLQYTDEERKAVNSAKQVEEEKKQDEQKRKMIRALIERIPTKKDDLFDYTLDWSMVDSTLMEKRIQPWITKKIMEYIGEEEPTLVEFICSKIMTKSNPDKILEDISMVLDDEAEVFVVKMWRLLIYETEAKKEGLTK
ncbi:RNA-binding protein 25-like [Ciona intestinalis]